MKEGHLASEQVEPSHDGRTSMSSRQRYGAALHSQAILWVQHPEPGDRRQDRKSTDCGDSKCKDMVSKRRDCGFCRNLCAWERVGSMDGSAFHGSNPLEGQLGRCVVRHFGA
jgi:hypothetical protein